VVNISGFKNPSIKKTHNQYLLLSPEGALSYQINHPAFSVLNTLHGWQANWMLQKL
jgi:hypothetical protein